MNNILLPPINIPCTLFETISLFDDFSADDMQGNDSNLLIVFYVQIMPDDFVMQLHRF